MRNNTQTNRSSYKPKAPPMKRWLRRFLFLFGCFLLLVGVVSYFTRPARLNRVLVDMIEQSVGCEATVGRAHLTWDGLLTVDGIELTVPNTEGDFSKLLHTDRVAVQLRLLPLLIGQVRAASVALNQPKLYLTEDLDNNRSNFEMLLALSSDDKAKNKLPDALPELRLNGGQLCFGQQSNGTYRVIESLQFDGKLNADLDDWGVYDFELRQREPAAGSKQLAGPTVQGQIDLNQPMVHFEVQRFSFDGPYSYLLPEQTRRWWKQLSPRGDLQRVEFRAHRDENQQVLLAVEMQLDQFGLSLPLGAERPLELTDVDGTVIVTDNGVSFKQITGQVEGINFQAHGELLGFVQDAPFLIGLSTDPFDVPVEGGIWDSLPQAVSKYRERFNPQGTYQTKIELERAVADSEIKLRGHLDLIDTKFMYYRFKYPANQLTGRISFEDDKIVLNDLVGVAPSGAKAIVSGTIGPPIKDGTVAIKIQGDDMPLDEHLVNALKPKRREVLDMFFSREGYEQLLAGGVIRAPGETVRILGQDVVAKANDAVSLQDPADVPVFEPGGSASMTVHINRPEGKDQKYSVTTDLQAKGLSSLFKFWHYPLVAESGRIVISPDNVVVDQLKLRALNGGGGTINGRLILPDGDEPLKPNLQLTSIYLPVDSILIASIPKPKDQWVRSLNLIGELFGTGEVFADATGEVLFSIDARMRDGRAVPNGGRYVLDDITGSVTIERTRIQFEDFTGQHTHGGKISLNGEANYGESDVGVDLTFIADQLTLEPELIDLLPIENEGRPLLERMFKQYKPEGHTDAVLVYEGGRNAPEHFSLQVQPKDLDFDYHKQRIELTGLSGMVELTPELATFHDLAGGFADGTFKVNGQARLAENPGLSLTFKVNADRIDAPVRAVMPVAVRNLVDRLDVQGPFILEDARLLTWPEAMQGPTGIFEGRVELHGASASLGVPVTEMNALMDMRVVNFVDQPWPHTDIRFTADSLRAQDRLVQRVSMHAETGDQPWLINFNNLKGTVYNGTMVGRGQVDMSDRPVFAFDLTLQEAELEPFLMPLGEKASTYSAESESDADAMPMRDMSSGLLSAGLSVRVPSDKNEPIQGRGTVTVRDAKLYDRPLTLALLQAVSLNLPSESSFDRASARYLIYGNNLLFDDIRLEAPAFIISGTGTMSYPSLELNLRMVTQNPGALNLGPVSDLVRTFKDELLAIEVRGTLGNPKANVVPLDTVFRSWGRIFGNTRAPGATVHTEEPVTEE